MLCSMSLNLIVLIGAHIEDVAGPVEVGDEESIRGERFKRHHKDLKNFVDIIAMTQPEVLVDIHRQFLGAGADIIATNPFGATPVGMAEFDLQDLCRELNVSAVSCARQAADEFTSQNPEKPRFVINMPPPSNSAVLFDISQL